MTFFDVWKHEVKLFPPNLHHLHHSRKKQIKQSCSFSQELGCWVTMLYKHALCWVTTLYKHAVCWVTMLYKHAVCWVTMLYKHAVCWVTMLYKHAVCWVTMLYKHAVCWVTMLYKHAVCWVTMLYKHAVQTSKLNFIRRFVQLYVAVTVYREQSLKREYQQDETIQTFIVNFRCLLLTTVSTCFGHHYVHHQENKDRVLLTMVFVL